jgi:DNA-binding transcriptional regulator YhcF (GntR family)
MTAINNVYYLAGSICVPETLMAALSVDILCDAAVRIQLLERSITIAFADNTVRIKFPTTRRLAEFLDVPHYYVLPYFAMMEQEELVTRAERVGILTTAKGSRKMIELMREKYENEAREILGSAVFSELLKRC